MGKYEELIGNEIYYELLNEYSDTHLDFRCEFKKDELHTKQLEHLRYVVGNVLKPKVKYSDIVNSGVKISTLFTLDTKDPVFVAQLICELLNYVNRDRHNEPIVPSNVYDFLKICVDNNFLECKEFSNFDKWIGGESVEISSYINVARVYRLMRMSIEERKNHIRKGIKNG